MTTSMRFEVDLAGESIASYEVVGVFGELKELGCWSVQNAPILERTEDYNIWACNVMLPSVALLRYRYFIAAIDRRNSTVQLRRWETHAEARKREMDVPSCRDKFGWIDANKREVHRGWLNTGNIVLFKLFNNVLDWGEQKKVIEQLRLKLELVDPDLKMPIMPSPQAHVQYTCLKYGNSQLQEQSDHGVIYELDDMLVFHTILMNFSKVAFLFKLYATDERTGYVRHLGHQYILPQTLKGSEGVLSLALVSPSWTASIAKLKLQYLIISPMRDWRVRLNSTLIDYWPCSWKGLEVGHRGLGASYTKNKPAPLVENTIRSMIESYNAGFDMVEFNVQLTKDLVPIVYHDFQILVSKEENPISMWDLKSVNISSLTYVELKNSKVYKVIDEKIIAYSAPNNVPEEIDQLFPTLASMYIKTNKMLGFNIEIKWPQELYIGGKESSQSIDKNKYVDKVLETVKRFGWGRVCFFSSFDADVCTMLFYKQNMYPVLFLVPNLTPLYKDPRAYSLLTAVNTAQAFELAGIVQSAAHFHEFEDPVEIVKRRNKRIVLWGDMLCDRELIEKFKSVDVDAVISGCLDLALDKTKRNRFESDKKLQRLLALQLNSTCF